MITLNQVRNLIKGNPAVDQNIDLDGDEGFLLVLNDGWNWEEGDPGCYTRGWELNDVATIRDVASDLKHIVPYTAPLNPNTNCKCPHCGRVVV